MGVLFNFLPYCCPVCIPTQERGNEGKAFRGELTAEWREQHPELISGENSDEALLERIKAEREKLKPVKRARKKRVVS